MPVPTSTSPEYIPASDCSLLVRFGDEISVRLHERVVQLSRTLLSQSLPGLNNIHPAYGSVLLSFDPLQTNHSELKKNTDALLEVESPATNLQPHVVEMPVCYGSEFGPDLSDVARHCKLTEEGVVQIHSSGRYLVYFLGFSPGFPYLGGMPESISIPRLAVPRTKVPAGSVAIGGNQTGIYPLESPGGWRIIGRTPVRLFNPERTEPTMLQMGDIVRLKAITREEFRDWGRGTQKQKELG